MVKAGIDRIKIVPPEIKQVDIELMREIGEVVQGKPREFRYLTDHKTGEIIGFNKIEVRKTRYKELKANSIELVNYNTGQNILPMISYDRIDFNLPKQISNKQINNENVSNTKDFIKALGVIEEELEALGFGKLDLKESKVREIEINYNIPITRSFNEYERAINYIASLRNGHLRVGKGFEGDAYTGITIGNSEWDIKVYDKRRDIKNKTGIDIEESLRLEFTFKSNEKIKAIFGDNNLKDIIEDDFKRMQDILKEKILDNLVSKLYKDIERQVNHAIKHIEAYKSQGGGGNAVDEYLKNHQANLLDAEIIMEAMRSIVSSNHYARECRRAISSIKKIEGINLFGNINKTNGLLKALGYKEIKMDMTPTIRKEIKKQY